MEKKSLYGELFLFKFKLQTAENEGFTKNGCYGSQLSSVL